MNWELVEIDKSEKEVDEFKTIKIYDKNNGELFYNSIKEINELNLNKNLVTIIFDNKNDFFSQLYEDTLQKFISDSLEKYGFNKEKLRKYYLNLDRLFLNYLSSIRTFLDHSEVYLKRKYGASSYQFKEFEKATNIMFDRSFEYRFINKLRNYCQHIGMPLEYTLEVKNEGDDILAKLNIEFNSINLLESYDGWGAVVKKELGAISGKFDCIPIIHRISELILEIYKLIDLLRSKEITKAYKYIIAETSQFRKSNIDLCLVRKNPYNDKSDKIQVEMLQIPFHIIDLLNI